MVFLGQRLTADGGRLDSGVALVIVHTPGLRGLDFSRRQAKRICFGYVFWGRGGGDGGGSNSRCVLSVHNRSVNCHFFASDLSQNGSVAKAPPNDRQTRRLALPDSQVVGGRHPRTPSARCLSPAWYTVFFSRKYNNMGRPRKLPKKSNKLSSRRSMALEVPLPGLRRRDSPGTFFPNSPLAFSSERTLIQPMMRG